MDEKFSNLLQTARCQLKRGISQTSRLKMTYPEFIELFKIRGYQTIIEHKKNDMFMIDDNNIEVINLMYDYVSFNESTINPHIGILLNGNWGCGKSILIETFCKILSDVSNTEPIQVIHAIDLAEQIRINGVSPFIRKPLCIQDIGKEPVEVTSWGTKINPLTNLLAIRAEYGELTFGSMNIGFKTFEKTYQEFIAKRIKDYVHFICLKGESRRKDYSINQPK